VTNASTYTLSGTKTCVKVQDTHYDVLKRPETESSSIVALNASKEDSATQASHANSVADSVSITNSVKNSSSMNNISSDMNGGKALNNLNAASEKSIGNSTDADAERPAKIAKLDGTSVATR
jgi:hypothetical protein